MDTSTHSRASQDEPHQRLARDLRAVIDDAETLLKDVSVEAREGTLQAREQLLDRVAEMREKLLSASRAAADSAKRAGQATDTYVHEHPWQAVASTAVVAGLIGYLMGRR